MYLINESPHITSDWVRAEFQITRPVVGVRCFLRSQYDRVWKDCKLYLNNNFIFTYVHSVSFNTGSSGHVVFPLLRAGPHVLKIQAYNKKMDVTTVKRGFMMNSDPNYCSLVLIDRGVTVSEDGTSAVVKVRVFGPATQLSCVLDEEPPFICKYTSSIL